MNPQAIEMQELFKISRESFVAGAENERAAIVAWLRSEFSQDDAAEAFAVMIERGDHRA